MSDVTWAHCAGINAARWGGIGALFGLVATAAMALRQTVAGR